MVQSVTKSVETTIAQIPPEQLPLARIWEHNANGYFGVLGKYNAKKRSQLFFRQLIRNRTSLHRWCVRKANKIFHKNLEKCSQYMVN